MGNINQKLERLQLISDFLKDKLSAKKLENRLKTDTILQEELYKHKELIELFKKQQEQNVASLLEPKNDVGYTKPERVERRKQLRQELEKIKEQKIAQQEDWERRVAQSNQPSIYKMAAVFSLAIAIGAGVFVVATQLIDVQSKRALKAEVVAPTLVEVETDPTDALDKTKDNSLFPNKNNEAIVQNPVIETKTEKRIIATAPKKERLIAFQPIEEYENRLNRTTRSSITLKSPNVVVENYNKNLIFEWNGTSEEEIYLEIINFKKEVMTYENLESPFNLEQNLEKGIYYWILQTDSEVIKRGKFLVK